MTSEQHVITAIEPAWVLQNYVPDEDGQPEPVGEYETLDLIDSHFEDSTYECTCGEEFSRWDEAEAHLKEVTGA
jgi:hypothetical protein